MTELSVQASSFTSHALQEYIICKILLHNHTLSADPPNPTDQQLDSDNGITSHSLSLQALYLSAQHGTFLLSCDITLGFPKCMGLRQSVCSPQMKHWESCAWWFMCQPVLHVIVSRCIVLNTPRGKKLRHASFLQLQNLSDLMCRMDYAQLMGFPISCALFKPFYVGSMINLQFFLQRSSIEFPKTLWAFNHLPKRHLWKRLVALTLCAWIWSRW